MRWSRVNSTCIQSGAYKITKYTLGGRDLYEVYHDSELVGAAEDGNKARKIAAHHAKSQEVGV